MASNRPSQLLLWTVIMVLTLLGTAALLYDNQPKIPQRKSYSELTKNIKADYSNYSSSLPRIRLPTNVGYPPARYSKIIYGK